MITVLHAFPAWLPLTQTWMYTQVRFLPAEVEAHVVCQTTENLDQFKVAKLHALSREPLGRRLWEKGLRRLHLRPRFGFVLTVSRRVHAQVLHSHFGDLAWAYAPAAARAGLKHVCSFYGYDLGWLPRSNPVWLGRYRELFASVDRVLCEGSRMAESLQALGCPAAKIRVHHLGVSLGDIPFRPRRWSPGEPLRVLIAASFQEKKGIPDAVEALGRLQSRVRLEITIVGDANTETKSQAEKAKILAAIERNGLGPRTRLLGYRSWAQLFEEAYRHHVFLHPSVTAADGDSEGGVPVTLIEMAATGMPVVSTTHADIPEVVLHGTTGLLAREHDVEGLVACMERLVSQPQAWDGMVQAARLHLEENYDAVKQGQHLARLYAEVVAA